MNILRLSAPSPRRICSPDAHAGHGSARRQWVSRATYAVLVAAAALMSACGGSAASASSPPSVGGTPAATAAPTAAPTLGANSIHVVLTGDVSVDATGMPIGACGQNTSGGWSAAMTNPSLFVLVTQNVYRGPGSYPLVTDPTSTNASALVIGLATSTGKQTVETSSGYIRIDQSLAHAHIEADGGFTVPPDFTTVTGHVHMVMDISC